MMVVPFYHILAVYIKYYMYIQLAKDQIKLEFDSKN